MDRTKETSTTELLQSLPDRICREFDRRLIDANESDSWSEYKYKSGYNKGVRDAAMFARQVIREALEGDK